MFDLIFASGDADLSGKLIHREFAGIAEVLRAGECRRPGVHQANQCPLTQVADVTERTRLLNHRRRCVNSSPLQRLHSKIRDDAAAVLRAYARRRY